jgi:hypothetical protein
MKSLSLLTWLYDIDINRRGIAFVLLRILVIHRLPFEGIKRVIEIRHTSLGSISAYNFKNRLFARSFLIQTRSGWFTQKILVTPKNPQEFLEKLREHSIDIQ